MRSAEREPFVPATRLHEYDEPETAKTERAVKHLRSLGYKVEPPPAMIVLPRKERRAA